MFRVTENYATERDCIVTHFNSEAEAHAYAKQAAEDVGGIARRVDLDNGTSSYDATPEGCLPSWVKVEFIRLG